MQSIKDKPGYFIRHQYEEEQKQERLRRLAFTGYRPPDTTMSGRVGRRGFTNENKPRQRPDNLFSESYQETFNRLIIAETCDTSKAVVYEGDDIESYHIMSFNFSNEKNSLEDLFIRKYSESSSSESESDDEEEPLVQTTCQQEFKSELQAIPFMQQCILLGGGREKKKHYVSKRKPVKKRYNKNKSSSGLGIGIIAPPSRNVTFSYIDNAATTNAPTASFRVKSIRINTFYDPDPAVLTSGYGGWATVMQQYNFFRVNRNQILWEPSNNETFPLIVGLTFSNTPLDTTIVTRQEAIDALENGFSPIVQTLQNRNGGQSVYKFRSRIACWQLLGDKSLYYGDENYVGTATNDPNDLLFVNLIVISPVNSTFLLNGVVGKFQMRTSGKLFSRTYLDDTLMLKKKKEDAEKVPSSVHLSRYKEAIAKEAEEANKLIVI